MHIRTYQPSDKSRLITLLRLNTPTYFHPSEEEDFVAYLEKELEEYFVLELEGEIVGCGGINYFPAENLARIAWDMVHPDVQGKRVGRALVQHRIQRIQEQPKLSQIVVRTSQLANQFYAKMGFELVEIVKDYWAEGLDLYYMQRSV